MFKTIAKFSLYLGGTAFGVRVLREKSKTFNDVFTLKILKGMT